MGIPNSFIATEWNAYHWGAYGMGLIFPWQVKSALDASIA